MWAMSRSVTLASIGLLAVLLLGCEVRVQRDRDDRAASVDVETPLGDVSVRSDVSPSDVGLPVYPGATRLDDRDEHDSASVSVDSPFGGVRVAAMKFESDASPENVADFYSREMRAYGAVTVCRGNIDFDESDRGGPPQCRERSRARRVDVAVGTSSNFHMASVKPRGNGSEFAVVYVRASRPS
jgi:hypothetical protein